ncbi:hypothetical protein CDD80_2858 [Ophiocordyceps camponoti-rufipedis]|uniref:DSC E3 ubiquitin ligase complex subunit A n=1 Tax=Ophiocordyceps camponoti-rufipedis TaxID=2004952 RepID=A0A2C5Z4P1_9HYPO|nr:hypothetical protein CDD80_2858 [Ophiocordyceps camponoti-rufipedis]
MPFGQHPVAGLVLLLLFLWMLFPESEYQSVAQSELAAGRLARYRDALDTLGASSWGDFAPDELHDATADTSDDSLDPTSDAVPDAAPNATSHFLNLTGFRQVDGFAWEDLASFREKALRLSHHAIPLVAGRQLWDVAQGEAVWANASGTLRGEWVRRPGSVARRYDSYNLSLSVPDMAWAGEHAEWARNMTGDAGRMTLRLEANRTVTTYDDMAPGTVPLSGGVIRDVRGTVTVEDTNGSGHNWEMRLWGVHWPRQGVILMTTTSEKFEGIFGLPHLAPGPDFFLSSQSLLNSTLNSVIATKQQNINLDPNMPWNSDVDNMQYTAYPSPHCEFIMYAQVYPPIERASPAAGGTDGSEGIISAIEAELEHPLGAPIGSVPRLKMSTVIYSPDCAFFLESKGPPDFPPMDSSHLVGMKTEVHLYQVQRWLIAFALVISFQVYLFKNQMKETFTPSTMGRISFWTLSAMAVVDCMTFIAALTWMSSAGATFLPTLTLAFTSFASTLMVGCLLSKVHEVQLPEGRLRREAGPGDGGAVPTTTTTPPRTVPPASEPAPATSLLGFVTLPSDQDIGAEMAMTRLPSPQSFQNRLGRLLLFTLCITLLAVSSSTWHPRARSFFLNLCAFAYLSMWVPQVYRNTMRNCRRAMRWPFVAGQTSLRLLPVAYFWIKEDNFLYARTDTTAFCVLLAWVWLQLAVLAVQEVMGPRFCVPVGWTPDGWDYHPVLGEDAIEAGSLPIGLVADDSRRRGSNASAKRGNVRAIDCAICHEALEVPVLKAGDDEGSVASVFARRLYMMTPCRHIFHTHCLEGWMRVRLQCPICREDLPPI